MDYIVVLSCIFIAATSYGQIQDWKSRKQKKWLKSSDFHFIL